MKQNNINKKKGVPVKRTMAAVLCLVIAITSILPVNVIAKQKKELYMTLTYKGNTLILNSMNKDGKQMDKWTTFKKIKKAFGEPSTHENLAGKDIYGYKEKGFLFSFYAVEEKEPVLGRVNIEIKSTDAALNGIKIGMSFNSVQKKLEKEYGKSFVKASKEKGKIQLEYADYFPIQYKFKNGKVSKMKFFCS